MKREARPGPRRPSLPAPRLLFLLLAFLFVPTSAPGEPPQPPPIPAPAPAPAPDAGFPAGFRDVKWGMRLEDVKRVVAQEKHGKPTDAEGVEKGEILQVERYANCATRGEKPCVSLIARPGEHERVYKEAEYFFNPFSGNIMRIVVKYKKDYVEIDQRFSALWGPPASEKSDKVEGNSYLPEGKVVDKTWRKGRTAVNLHYAIYPAHSNIGTVEFVDLEETKAFDFVAEQYGKLGGEPRADGKRGEREETREAPLY